MEHVTELPLPSPEAAGAWAVDALKDMPSERSWGRLIAGLRWANEISGLGLRSGDTPPGLDAAIVALNEINTFLANQPITERSEIVQPLNDLASALLDVRSGKTPPMFRCDPSRNTHGLSTQEMFCRAIAALALDNLMQTPQYKRKLDCAALIVARALGGKTTATEVKDWRKEIKRGKAPQDMIHHFCSVWPTEKVGTTPQERADAFLYGLREKTLRVA